MLWLEPSEVFWLLIQRRVKNSHARKGLELISLQRLHIHSVAANHIGSSEPWACASIPKDGSFCYNHGSWIQCAFLLSKGSGNTALTIRTDRCKASLHWRFLPWMFWPWPYISFSSSAKLSLFTQAMGYGQAHGYALCLHRPRWWDAIVLAWP